MDWDDLRYLLAVGRGGTLSAAARRLGVDQTTVARRLARLEGRIGERLFLRTDGRMRATAAGERALAHAAEMERRAEAVAAGRAAGEGAAAGTVRLTAVPILVQRLLLPAVPRLLADHPGLTLELLATPGNLQLQRGDADLALRLARPQSGRVLARRLGRLDYAVYAPVGPAADDLPWIGYDTASADLPPARWLERRAAGAFRLRLNDSEAILAAVRGGLGRSLLPCFAADADAGLVRCDGPTTVLAREIWLLVPPEIRDEPRIRAVGGWLASRMPGAAPQASVPRIG